MIPTEKLKIKICGITRLSDAKEAVRLGADFLGFVFYPQSPRYILPEKAGRIISGLPKKIKKVGVFVNEKPTRVKLIAKKCSLDILQFHGKESKTYCRNFPGYQIIKALRVKDTKSLKGIHSFEADWFLLDSYSAKKFGGTGKTFNWDLLKKLNRNKIRLMFSGGLNHKNIALAINKIKPEAVDISSGIESSPGKKSRKLMRQLFKAIHNTHG